MVGDFLDYYNIALDLLFGFFALFAVTRILGRVMITQITTFDFVCSIVLGEFVGNALYDPDVGIGQILFALTIWGALIYTTEWVTQKYRFTRNFLEGSPCMLINRGKLSFQELKKCHIDLDQLLLLLRSKDVFSVREVEYAILEADGSLSVLKKSSYETPIRSDYSFPEQPVYLPITLIVDGEVLWDNLVHLGYSRTWFTKEIEKYNLTFKKVLYAEWLEGSGLFLQEY